MELWKKMLVGVFSEHSVVSTLFDVFLSLYNYVNIGVKSK